MMEMGRRGGGCGAAECSSMRIVSVRPTRSPCSPYPERLESYRPRSRSLHLCSRLVTLDQTPVSEMVGSVIKALGETWKDKWDLLLERIRCSC